jgi:hypothetical protein
MAFIELDQKVVINTDQIVAISPYLTGSSVSMVDGKVFTDSKRPPGKLVDAIITRLQPKT